jgi:hypothetical protein
MAFLDSQTVTIDAILTQRGRELLAQNGNLNITSFALADDEIDYTLYDPTHPGGSVCYDIALRNTPIFEPLTDEIAQSNISVPSSYTGNIVISPSTAPAYNLTAGYTAILGNKNVGTLIVQKANALNTPSNIMPSFIGNINVVSSQVAVGNVFAFIPNSTLSVTTTTNLTIVGNESGGSISVEVTVIVPQSLTN